MTKRAISYVRFSSLPQGKGDSVPRQVERCRAYCAREGLVLDESEEFTFTDRGLSAYKGANLGEEGELRRFINLVDEGRVEPGTTLVVESLDRLSRQDVYTALSLLLSLVKKGIRVATLTGAGQVFEKGAPDWAIMMAIVEMIRAHEESAVKEKRVRAAKQAKLQRARDHGEGLGHASHPLWLRFIPEGRGGHYEPFDDRVDVVRQIFDWAINGRGQTAIAGLLTAQKMAPFRGEAGDPWNTSSVGRILRSTSAFGVFQPRTMEGSTDGKPVLLPEIRDYFPPAVTEGVFMEAQIAMSLRRNDRDTKQSKRFNVWAKVAKCIECGGPLNLVNKGKPPKGAEYLRCYRATRGLCRATKHVRLDQAEEVFHKMLIRLDSMSLIHDNSAAIERELRVSQGKLQAKHDLHARYVADYQRTQEAGLPSKTILALMSATEAEIAELETLEISLGHELGEEKGTQWLDMLESLDLTAYENRARANRLVRRLDVLAFIGGADYVITQGDDVRFGMSHKDGEAGFLMHSWPSRSASEELHTRAQHALREMYGFVPATRVGLEAFVADEETSDERYEALEDERQDGSEY